MRFFSIVRFYIVKNQGLSLARAESFNTNERYVCTCCEFWQFQLLVLCWNSTFAKTQENLRFEIKVCPLFYYW